MEKIRTKEERKRQMMLFRKSERKKLPAIIGLTVGGLAVIGAMSIKKSGKHMVRSAVRKMKSVFHKNSGCECADACE